MAAGNRRRTGDRAVVERQPVRHARPLREREGVGRDAAAHSRVEVGGERRALHHATEIRLRRSERFWSGDRQRVGEVRDLRRRTGIRHSHDKRTADRCGIVCENRVRKREAGGQALPFLERERVGGRAAAHRLREIERRHLSRVGGQRARRLRQRRRAYDPEGVVPIHRGKRYRRLAIGILDVRVRKSGTRARLHLDIGAHGQRSLTGSIVGTNARSPIIAGGIHRTTVDCNSTTVTVLPGTDACAIKTACCIDRPVIHGHGSSVATFSSADSCAGKSSCSRNSTATNRQRSAISITSATNA